MQITCADIEAGQIFYATKIVGEFHEFGKFQALSPTAKQVKAIKTIYKDSGVNYAQSLRSADWCFFTDFESAREYWIENKLNRDVAVAETRLARCKALIYAIKQKTDI